MGWGLAVDGVGYVLVRAPCPLCWEWLRTERDEHNILLASVVALLRVAGDDGGSEPPLKRARSSSGGVGGDASSAALAAADSMGGTSGLDGREETPQGQGSWRDGVETRDAALNAELAKYMIRTEPLGTDRHHQRYWYMHVSVSARVSGVGFGDLRGAASCC